MTENVNVDEESGIVQGQEAPKSALNIDGTVRGTLKRFRFSGNCDLFLLRAVRANDAHIPARGKVNSLYVKVLNLFLKLSSAEILESTHKPYTKTLIDRFKRLVQQRRNDVKRTAKASGIHEAHGEKEVLLDDLIAEIYERDEMKRAEQEQRMQNNKRLQVAVDEIRTQAVKRRVCNSTESTPCKRILRMSASQSDEDLVSSILQSTEQNSLNNSKKLALEEQRLEHEINKVKNEGERFLPQQKTQNEKLLSKRKTCIR